MDISTFTPIIEWIIYQYVVSVIIGSLVIEFIGSALARRVLIKLDIAGIGITLTVGFVVGFFLRRILGI